MDEAQVTNNDAGKITANARAVWKETSEFVDKYFTRFKTLLSNSAIWALGVNQSVLLLWHETCDYIDRHVLN